MAGLGWFNWRRVVFGPTWHIDSHVEAADQVPTQIPRFGAVLVGSAAHPKWLAFDCPCGRGHRILLNLEQSRWPHWTVRGDKRVTVRPSVRARTTHGECHFFITRGRTTWIDDRRRQR